MKRNTTTFTTHSCILCGLIKCEKRSFFNFPKNEWLKKEWITKCDLPEEIDVSSARLCSKHFKKEDYSNVGNGSVAKRIRLKKDSVPSIFCNESLSEPGKECNSSTHKIKTTGQYCMICKRKTMRSTTRLPKNKNEAEKWLKFFNIQPKVGNRDIYNMNVRICEKHFEKIQYKRNFHQKRPVMRLIHNCENDSEISRSVEQSVDAPLNESIQALDNELVLETFDQPCSISITEPVEILVTPTYVTSDRMNTDSAAHLIFPDNPNNICMPHLNSLRNTERSLQTAKNVIAKQKSELLLMKQQLHRANIKIKNLEQMITQLCDQDLLTEGVKKSIMHKLSTID